MNTDSRPTAPCLLLALALLTLPVAGTAAPDRPVVPAPDLPERTAVTLEATGHFGPGAERENSGIVKSRIWPDTFWVQNDSGDEPRVYPVTRTGEVIGAVRYDDEPGVRIGGAINVDWEDIAVDDSGQLIVADVGNNRNDRRDLALYFLPEPSPRAGRTTWKRKVFFRYPDQHLFPAPSQDFNYDCEGVFFAHGKIYFVTKHRSDPHCRLYRLDSTAPHRTHTLTFVDAFAIGGKTTGADATPDGRRLAITTYDALWVFETGPGSEGWFRGKIYWMPFKAPQVEAVCFDGPDRLLLADEEAAALYTVDFADLTRVDDLTFRPLD
ncbi:MAG: hypothetical protein ACFE0O_05625 [Opitutales bacterium]